MKGKRRVGHGNTCNLRAVLTLESIGPNAEKTACIQRSIAHEAQNRAAGPK